MAKRYIQIFTVITIFVVNGIKSDDTINALKKILQELNAPVEDRYDEANYNYKILHHPRQHKPAKSKHDNYSPNLMNVQTMNLYLKPNEKQREEAKSKRMLRTENKMCMATGRCGCSGGRCGSNNEDQLADEVDRVVNEINKQLPNDKDKWTNNRGTFDEDRDDDDRNRDRDEIDRQRDKDDENRINNNKHNNESDESKHREDDDDTHRNLDDRKNRLDMGDIFKIKRVKVNDNLNVVIIFDLDVLLRNKDFIDLTRKDKNDDDYDEDREIFNKALEEFEKPVAKEIKRGHYRSFTSITPEEFFGHYETVKQQLVTKVFSYVKNKDLSSFLNFKQISPYQRSKLRTLKLKYMRGEVQDDVLEEEIVKILFGAQSNMRIVAQKENNNKIYVPDWFYQNILTTKNKGLVNLRAQKTSQSRILPLTIQQKERLSNKVKGKKIIPKVVWRKNAGQDIQGFGIPFSFEVHGLGQMAP